MYVCVCARIYTYTYAYVYAYNKIKVKYKICLENKMFLYRSHSLQRVKKTESYLLSLPVHHQKLLSKYKEHLQEVKRCIEYNNDIIRLIIKDVAHIFENVSPASAQNDSVRKLYLVCGMFDYFV